MNKQNFPYFRFPLDRCLRQNGTGLDHLAIRITEINNQSISVYGINKDRWTADGFLALPDEMVIELELGSLCIGPYQ